MSNSTNEYVQKHLVLGGSLGIGLAFAVCKAEKGDHVKVIARREEFLNAAQKTLAQAGACSVEILSGDLLDSSFLSKLQKDGEHYDSIFISGPSPCGGCLEKIHSLDNYSAIISDAYRTAIAYPLEIIQWALGPGLRSGGSLYVVGSSASKKQILNTPFYLSAIFRRILDALVDEYTPIFHRNEKKLKVWRPEVVLTPLSINYACKQAKSELVSNQKAKEILEELFGLTEIPDSQKYVTDQLALEEDKGARSR
ncbi:hypothetical protein [Nitrosomonas marina]|uniref:Short chain dehydrogenase n=1 Tax=Nitrosomonas marina TaxID=917 RepID=A0A1H8G3P5_9PROT|nr:hypothetical protein [Nitrosomonas marina]SEN38414.1 hypothetical protein SAMN05216325_11610 [Nitrosomonas marina]